MNTDPLSPYTMDGPLSDEEIEAVRLLPEIAPDLWGMMQELNVCLEKQSENKLFLRANLSNSDATNSFMIRFFALSFDVYQSGNYNLSLGLISIVLRLTLHMVGEHNNDTLGAINGTAFCLNNLGRQSEALPLFKKVLDIYQDELGEEHPSTLESLNNFTGCLNSSGQSQEALPLCKKAVELCQRGFDEYPEDFLTSCDNLAFCLIALGNVNEALPLCETTLITSTELLGDDHSGTLDRLSNLVACLNQLNRSKEALPLAEKALKLRQQILGEQHRDTLESLNSITTCLRNLMRLQEALPLAEKALELCQQTLGDNDPYTLISISNYGLCLLQLKRGAEALPLLEKSLVLSQQIWGEAHSTTLVILHGLVFCLVALERKTEALSLCEKLLALSQSVYGEQSVFTLAATETLAGCLLELNRATDALLLCEKTIAIRKSIASEADPTTSINLILARCFDDLGRKAEALVLYQKKLLRDQREFGENNLETLKSMGRLANCLEDLGREAEALPLYQQALKIRQQVSGNEHPDTLKNISRLANCLINLGRVAEALTLHQELLILRQRVIGEEHPDTLNGLSCLADCLMDLNREAEALPLFKQVLILREKVLGERHIDTLKSFNKLTQCLQHLKLAEEALPIAKKGIRLCRHTLGFQHAETFKSYFSLAQVYLKLRQINKAMPLFKELSASKTQLPGKPELNYLLVLNGLISCHIQLGQYHEAILLSEEVLALAKQTSREDTSIFKDLALIFNSLALNLRTLGKFNKSVELFEDAFIFIEKHGLDKQNANAKMLLNNHALCLVSAGRASDALTLLEKNEVFNKDSYKTPITQDDYIICNTLAMCFLELGRITDASALLEKCVKFKSQMPEIKNSDHIYILNNYGLCFHELGRITDAIPLFETALHGQQQLLGEDHPETLVIRNNLIQCFIKVGRVEEALPLCEKTLASSQQLCGEKHPNTALGFNNMAMCLDKLGRTNEAIPFFEKALELSEKALGELHPYTLNAYNNLAHFISKLDQSNEAQQKSLLLFEKAVTLSQRSLGKQHPRSLMIINNLVWCLHDLGDIKNARSKAMQLLQSLSSCVQPGGWILELLGYVISYLADPIKQGDFPGWATTFQELDQALREVLDLQDPRQLTASRKEVVNFYQTYLALCLELRPDLVPTALTGLQGRKLASLVLDEMESQAYPADSLQGQLMAVRCKLRELALGLHVYENNQSDLINDDFQGDRSLRRLQQQKNLWQAYEAGRKEYRELQGQLAALDSPFSLLAKVLKPELAALQSGLKADSALIMLLQATTGIVAFVITAQTTQTIPLSGQLLTACAPVTPAWADNYSRLSLADDNADASDQYDTAMQEKTVLLGEQLWQPLRHHLPTIRQVHIVSQGVLHLLPYELACPDEWQATLSTYPGLVHYYLLHHVETNKPAYFTPASALGLRVHGAETSKSPIPMVHAEAEMISLLWTGTVHQPFSLTDSTPKVDWIHFAAHGNVAKETVSEAYLDFGTANRVGFHEIFNSPQQPCGVFISSCLAGQTHEDDDGDPLGLISAFSLKGVRYIIAALVPVSDLYMPILACLFYQSFNRLGTHPGQALTEAKRRLQTGDWYEDTEPFIRATYKGRQSEELINTLCNKRTLPFRELEKLCVWVRGFGVSYD
jgi:tetratricopeptide (TPR) repeat protein